MKKLKLPILSDPLSFDVSNNVLLIVENRDLFFKICEFCFNDFGGKDYFQAFEDDTKIDAEEICYFLPSIFNLDLNTKKNINALNKRLKTDYCNDYFDDISCINVAIKGVLANLKLDCEFPITFNEDITFQDILEFVNIRFDEISTNKIERFIRFIKIINELFNKKIFIVLHLKSYFCHQEIDLIFKELSYLHISIIDIESYDQTNKNLFNVKIIIDQDLNIIK